MTEIERFYGLQRAWWDQGILREATSAAARRQRHALHGDDRRLAPDNPAGMMLDVLENPDA